MNIIVEALINAPIEKVQSAYPSPQDIKQRNAASDDWRSTAASVDLREGGTLSSYIEAKGGSFGFDFAGIHTKILLHQRIEQKLQAHNLRKILVKLRLFCAQWGIGWDEPLSALRASRAFA